MARQAEYTENTEKEEITDSLSFLQQATLVTA